MKNVNSSDRAFLDQLYNSINKKLNDSAEVKLCELIEEKMDKFYQYQNHIEEECMIFG